MKKIFLLPCFLVCMIGFCSAADVAYKFTILDLQPQETTDTIRFVDRNNKSEMVGITVPSFLSYFVASNKTVTQLTCPGDFTIVHAINNAGQIAGDCVIGGISYGFIFDRRSGVYTLLSYPGSTGTFVYGINDRGHAVGQYYTGTGADITTYHGFIWKDGVYTNVDFPDGVPLTALHGINKQGQAAGTYFAVIETQGNVSAGFEVSFILDNGSFPFVSYPGSSTNRAMDINNNGQVIALTYDNGAQIWYLYDRGDYFKITGLPEDAVQYNNLSWGINDKGEIAGTYLQGTFTEGVVHSFVAVPAPIKGMRR